MQSCF